jgi:hypothetical protein
LLGPIPASTTIACAVAGRTVASQTPLLSVSHAAFLGHHAIARALVRLLHIIPTAVFPFAPVAVRIAPIRITIATRVDIVALCADETLATAID